MYKHNLSSNNHRPSKKIILSIFCITALGLSLSAGRASRLSATDNQGGNKIPGGASKETIIESINIRNLEGKEETIKLRGQKKATIIYVFVPECPYSMNNFENVKRLATERGNSYRFFGVSLLKTNLQEFIDANKPNFPIYNLNSTGNSRQLGLGMVPQTIVISPEGKILKNWVRAYSEGLKSEVEKYFNVRLPGPDLRGKCTYCLDDAIAGSLYSPGAEIKSGGRRLLCKPDGQWRVL